jgi:hypothetical protein
MDIEEYKDLLISDVEQAGHDLEADGNLVIFS